MSGPQLVFGYGSLAAGGGGTRAQLRGHRRVWGVAMDNSRDLPGYKHYLLRCDGSRPAVHVAFLDIVPDPESVVEGIVLAVDEASLRELDQRERNYDRVDVTAAVVGATGTVWAYVGSPQGRARLREGRDRGSAVISREYLEAVRARSGPAQLTAREPSSDLDGLDVWDLVRVPHSGRAPR
jgi:gamma-glutamylcyclotransferase (GGCT)/AIG2-like uncharacterized protein YtfP